MPRFVTPDLLTCVGVLGSVLAGVGCACSGFSPWLLLLVVPGMVGNWLGDALDGALARFRQCERPAYGFFIDHCADACSVLLVTVGVGLSPFVRMDCALLVATAYFLQMILSLMVLCVRGVFHVSFGVLGPAEARMGVAAASIVTAIVHRFALKPLLWSFTMGDLIALTVAAILLVSFMASAMRELARLPRSGAKGGFKSEIRSSKSETNAENSGNNGGTKNGREISAFKPFPALDFNYCFVFRDSDFGFIKTPECGT
jgi:phosphatidylglycerophosphate synthase